MFISRLKFLSEIFDVLEWITLELTNKKRKRATQVAPREFDWSPLVSAQSKTKGSPKG